MTENDDAAAIIAVYERNGWMLRRLIAKPENLAAFQQIANGKATAVNVAVGDVNAAWFSRPPAAGPIAWELRAIDRIPYALLEYFDEAADGLDERLAAVEHRLALKTTGKDDA